MDPITPPQEPDEPEVRQKASLRQVAGAVFWSFFGIRKHKDYQADVNAITPLQIVIMGILGGVLLVLGIALLVHFIVS